MAWALHDTCSDCTYTDFRRSKGAVSKLQLIGVNLLDYHHLHLYGFHQAISKKHVTFTALFMIT